MFTDLLIHLDTLGHMPSSAIIGLGGIAFSRDDPTAVESMYHAVSMASNVRAKRTMDPETFDWWRTDGPYDAPFRSPQIDINDALNDFVSFVRSTARETTTIWLWSAATHGGILYSALQECGFERPWSYYRERDARTFANIAYYAKYGHYFASPQGDSPHDQMMRRVRALREVYSIYAEAFAPPVAARA